ncbi:MAG: class I SAM-dependent methyltransferase [Clostridia bacterium]|nr:class I SAM-dependent methyltransferase [Clostridia bacterium]
MQQNIYDNDEFFDNYKNTRLSDDSFNELLEQPAMRKLIPDLQGKSVLDLGCGFGFNCKEFALAGAKSVVGIDLSEKMIEQANATNSTDNITYHVMSMMDIDTLNEKFDFVFSSLAFHYIEDFEKLISQTYSVLNDDGVLLFSQEHPIVTAVKNNGENYVKKLNGSIKGFLLNNYADMSIRKEKWFVDGVEKYHRTFSFIINTLIKCGFTIEAIDEPLPSEEALKTREGLKKEFIKPTFLIVKAKKTQKKDIMK